MSAEEKIDAIDRRILTVLQRDASLSIQQIGDEVGVSANPCWRRIKRLESLGIIKKRTAVIDAARLGLGMTCFVSIRTNRHTAEWLDTFAKGVEMIPEIVECHRMTGDVDYLLKIIVADLAHYDRVYRHLISSVPDLADVSSTFSMEQMKCDTEINLTAIKLTTPTIQTK